MDALNALWVRRSLRLNLVIYTLLAIAKCSIGMWAHAQVVWADGWNNVSDLSLSIAMLIGFRVAQRPADAYHSFGHRRAENVVALVAALFMAVAALQILLSAIIALTAPTEETAPHPIALWASLASALIMGILALFNTYLSRRTTSEMLRVVMHDNRADMVVSLGAAVGLWGVGLTGLRWLDPVIAIMVACLVARTAWQVGQPAMNHLMDGFDQEHLQRIRARVSAVEGILQVRELRARSHGTSVCVEVTVGVDANLSVAEGHRLSEHVEASLVGYEDVWHVHVHVEPEEGNHAHA